MVHGVPVFISLILQSKMGDHKGLHDGVTDPSSVTVEDSTAEDPAAEQTDESQM